MRATYKRKPKSGKKAFDKEVAQRAGHVCEECRNPEGCCTHHVFGKRYQSIKYDPDNGCWLCVPCHAAAHAHPEEFRQWIKYKRGLAWWTNLVEKRNKGQGINGYQDAV